MLKSTSIASNVARRCLTRSRKHERCMASKRTVNLQAPSTVMTRVSGIDFEPTGIVPTRRSPAGWSKTMASSAIYIPSDDEMDLHEADSASSGVKAVSSSDMTLEEVHMDALGDLAVMRCTPLSLKDMYKYAVDFSNSEQRLRNAQFLHKELPIRMAHRAYDLLTLPTGLRRSAPIRQVAHIYLQYLKKFQEFPVPTTAQEEAEFTEMLTTVVLNRSSVPNSIAKGVDEWFQMHAESISDGPEKDRQIQEMEDALYRFFTARTGLRFLTEHHILSSPSRRENCASVRRSQSSFMDEEDVDTDFLGCIQTDCDPSKEVRKVASKIKRQTEDYYGWCPEIQIIDSTRKSDSKFTYVPHHLHYMVGELIKNSCRATLRRYRESNQTQPMQPIRVVIVKGDEDVTIKIADRGGGIPRSKMKKVWSFAHSTAGDDEDSSDFGVNAITGTQLRGFGLPLARVYARYLGGDLTLKSMEGYGVDAYLHLPRLGDACENLPLEVRYSPGELNSNAPRKIST